MRTASFIICALVILLGGAYLTHSQAQTDAETPQAVYEDCQNLKAEIKTADAEINELEYQIERAQAAMQNYEYVTGENARLLARLEQWVEAK